MLLAPSAPPRADGSDLTSADSELPFLSDSRLMLAALAAAALLVACASLVAYYCMRSPSRRRSRKSNQIEPKLSHHASAGGGPSTATPGSPRISGERRISKRPSRDSYLSLQGDEEAEQIAGMQAEGPLAPPRSTAAGEDQDAVAGLEVNPSFRATPRTASIRKAGGMSKLSFGLGNRRSAAVAHDSICDDSERTEAYPSGNDSQRTDTCDDSGRTEPYDGGQSARGTLSHNDFGLTRGLSALRSFMRGETLERRRGAPPPPPPPEPVEPEFVFDPVTKAYRRTKTPSKLPKLPSAPSRESCHSLTPEGSCVSVAGGPLQPPPGPHHPCFSPAI